MLPWIQNDGNKEDLFQGIQKISKINKNIISKVIHKTFMTLFLFHKNHFTYITLDTMA
jgi:hypothetical protein